MSSRAKNLAAVVLAAFVANLLGLAWYGMLFQNAWIAASGIDVQQAQATNGALVFLVPLGCWLAASLALFVLAHGAGLARRFYAALMIWFGGAMPAVVLATFFGMRDANLLWIDGGYLLAGVLVLACVQALIVRGR